MLIAAAYAIKFDTMPLIASRHAAHGHAFTCCFADARYCRRYRRALLRCLMLDYASALLQMLPARLSPRRLLPRRRCDAMRRALR